MFEIIFVLIGTFVGAGFASGKEIFNFFTIYKIYGIISIFIFSILLFILVYKCLNIKYNLKIRNYNEFIFLLEKKYKFFNNKLFLFFSNIFLASSFYIMIIGLSSLFDYQFNIEKLLTIFISIMICYIIFYKRKINFIYLINSILMPILILFIIFLCTFNINFTNINFSFFNENNIFYLFSSFFMGILYLSYNSLLLIPLIFNLKLIENKNNKTISLLYSLIIFILIFFINLLLLSFLDKIKNIDLPILFISNLSKKFFTYFYFFIILSAIFTTMISSGYSFISNFKEKNFNLKLLFFLLFSFVFMFFSFSSLINFLYPIFGLIGFIQIFLIFSYNT